MNKKFQSIRFSLFAKSYAGFILRNYIRQIENPEILIDRISKILLLDRKQLNFFIFERFILQKSNAVISPILKRNKKIVIYLQVERELITLIKLRQNREDLINEDYHFALLEPAIERVTGNNLSHVKNDRWFDKRLPELKRKYNRWYYEIACKYKLPTMRIVPFLIRLIT